MSDVITRFPDVGESGVTPMLAQFLQVKAAHSDCLLFYRMGDFYEMFFQDAVDAVAALDITLTKRGKVNGHDVPMCGVPVHSAEMYLSRLIRKGFRIAICEQQESPSEAKKKGNKGPLKRDVVRIVTPGTLVEDEFLPPRENNFLISLGQSGNMLALSWVDLSTGDFFVEAVSKDNLQESLARLSGAELIASDGAASDHGFTDGDGAGLVGSISLRPARLFSSSAGQASLCALYGVATLDGIADLGRAEYSAAGALVQYLDQTQKGRQIRLKPLVKVAMGSMLEIDPATRRSLEISKTLSGQFQGSLLSVIDGTRTAGGGRCLAQRISAPLTDIDGINQRLDLVGVMLADSGLLSAFDESLRTVPDIERALSRLSLGHGGPRDVASIGRGIASAYDMSSAIGQRQQKILAAEKLESMAEHLSAPVDLAAIIKTTLADDLPLLARDGGFIQQGFHAGLDEIKMLRDESRRLIIQLQAKYCENTGIGSLKIKHNNVLGYHIDVRIAHADKLMGLDEFIHRQTTAQAARFTTTELAELEQGMSRSVDRALALELELFAELTETLLSQSAAIIAVAEVIAQLDVAAASARLAQSRSYCRPQMVLGRQFDIKKGRHPVVEHMLDKAGGAPFISNDCALGDDDRIWLLTGPNMAGKSTFLRQNALIALMAQAGLYVPAETATIGVVDRLFCRVGASDDLATGRSTFMVEMVETAAILNRSGKNALVILDEIGRGTATYDGLSLAWAVVEYLHEHNGCRALFATHYHELNKLEKTLSGLSSHAIKVKEWQGDIVFLHEVIKGAADRSYGIHVARLAGVPPQVLMRAENVLQTLTTVNAASPLSQLDGLPLFSTQDIPSSLPSLSKPAPSPALDYLAALLPDTMTPKQALEAIYDMKNLSGGDE